MEGGGDSFGLGVEIAQWFGPYIGKDSRGSAFDFQDFYSNNVGSSFATYNLFSGNLFTKDWATLFHQWMTNK